MVDEVGVAVVDGAGARVSVEPVTAVELAVVEESMELLSLPHPASSATAAMATEHR